MEGKKTREQPRRKIKRERVGRCVGVCVRERRRCAGAYANKGARFAAVVALDDLVCAHDHAARRLHDGLEDAVQVGERRSRLHEEGELLLKVAAVVDLGEREGAEGHAMSAG